MSGLIEHELLTDSAYTVERLISDPGMRAIDRRRQVMHVIADATNEILAKPDANPTGLAITTSPLPQPNGIAGVRVLVTCPRFERVMVGSSLVYS